MIFLEPYKFSLGHDREVATRGLNPITAMWERVEERTSPNTRQVPTWTDQEIEGANRLARGESPTLPPGSTHYSKTGNSLSGQTIHQALDAYRDHIDWENRETDGTSTDNGKTKLTQVKTIKTATVRIRHPDGHLVQDAAIGDGPVDTIFKAVDRITGVAANLKELAVRDVTEGKDAQGEVTLELEVTSADQSFRGPAASTDIIEASAQAYISAVNAIVTRSDRNQPREVISRPGAGA